MFPSHSLRFRSLLALSGLLATLLSACANINPTSMPSATPVPATSTPRPTRTPPPTATPVPSLTPLPSATPTEQPTQPPPAPTPDPALTQVKLVGLAWLERYNMLLSFQFPGPVDPQDFRVTLEDKAYECEVLGQYPNRLYCHGQGAKVLAVAHVRIYQTGSDQPGFEKEVWVPYFK